VKVAKRHAYDELTGGLGEFNWRLENRSATATTDPEARIVRHQIADPVTVEVSGGNMKTGVCRNREGSDPIWIEDAQITAESLCNDRAECAVIRQGRDAGKRCAS